MENQLFSHVRYMDDDGKVLEPPVMQYKETKHEEFSGGNGYECLISFKYQVRGEDNKPAYHYGRVLLCVDRQRKPLLSIRQGTPTEEILRSSCRSANDYFSTPLALVPIMECSHVRLKNKQLVLEHRRVLDITRMIPLPEEEGGLMQ